MVKSTMELNALTVGKRQPELPPGLSPAQEGFASAHVQVKLPLPLHPVRVPVPRKKSLAPPSGAPPSGHLHLGANLVDRIVQVLDDVEPVEDVHRLGRPALDHVNARAPHVAGHELQRVPARFAQPQEEGEAGFRGEVDRKSAIGQCLARCGYAKRVLGMTTGLVLVELILFQFGGAQDAKRGVPSDARSESPSEASLPPKPTDDLNDVAWRGYHTAFAWLMESRKAEAVEILGLLVSRYPEHPSAERSQRVLDTMEGRATQPRGMEARENDPWSRYHLAFEALARGDKKRSRVTLEEIVTFNPKTAVGVRSRKVLAVPDRDPANFARRTGPAGGPARIPSEPRRGQKDRSTSARFQLGLRAAYMTLPGTDNYYDASADRPSSPTVGADLGLRLGNWLLAAVLDRAIMFREGHMTRANLSVQHFFEAGCLNECDNNSFWLGAAMGIRRSSVAERAPNHPGCRTRS